MDDQELEEGLERGHFFLDVRLRDALRTLAGAGELSSPPTFPPPGALPRLRFPLPSPAEEAAFADDLSALARFDAQVRLGERIEALERRLAMAERGRGVLAWQWLRRRWGGP